MKILEILALDLKIHSKICEELKCDQLCVGNDDGGKCLCSDHYEMDEMDVCKGLFRGQTAWLA